MIIDLKCFKLGYSIVDYIGWNNLLGCFKFWFIWIFLDNYKNIIKEKKKEE